jgi:hypothetical protein
MKKLVVLLIGLGVILAAGCQQDVLAQSADSLFLKQIQAIDSSESATLKQRAERNFAYIKAGPADPGKVTGELLAGGLGAIMGGVVFGKVGFGLASDGGGGGFGCCDVSGFIGGLVGYLVGSNVGSATGVCLVGNTGGERGSYWASLGGSTVGNVVGGLLAIAIVRESDDDINVTPFLILTASQAGGATIGFNATRKRKVEVPSGALLNLEEDKLSLSFPQVNASPDSFGTANFRIDLFQANF